MKNKDFFESIKKSKIFISAANFIASILFLISYIYIGNILLLVAALLLFCSALGIIIFFTRLEKKYKNIVK